MEIHSAKFIGSFPKQSECPTISKPEFAFIGRSNVGKSSLINMLCNHKDLAKTSSTPGKTQLINLFDIDKSWIIADLPGYGYAKVSKSSREAWGKMIKHYVTKRENLHNLFVLIDSNIPTQSIDIDFINFLGENRVPFSIVFTKTDRIKQQEVQDNLKAFKKKMAEYWEELPPIFLTSSSKTTGKKEILTYIAKISENYEPITR
jgi:GTP-binding protein